MRPGFPVLVLCSHLSIIVAMPHTPANALSPDKKYDARVNELRKLEAEHPDLITPDSPTQRVGGKPKEGFAKVAHSRPMLSLDNAYNEAELRAWADRVAGGLASSETVQYVCELKLDGLSLALQYVPGRGHEAVLL